MENKPIPPKSTDFSSLNIPVSEDKSKTEIEEKTEKISEVLIQSSQKEFSKLSKEEQFSIRKKECLKQLDAFAPSDNEFFSDFLDFSNYIKSLDSDLINDPDVYEKIYENYFFKSDKIFRITLSDHDYYSFLDILPKNTLKNPKIIKSIILKLKNISFLNEHFSSKILAEVINDKEFIIEYFKTKSPDAIPKIMRQFITENVIKDENFLKNLAIYYPIILKFDGVKKLSTEERKSILKKSVRPYEFLLTNFSYNSIKTIVLDKNLFLTMNNNSIKDEKEKQFLTNLCIVLKEPVFDIQKKEDFEFLKTIWMDNGGLLEPFSVFPHLFENEDMPAIDWDKDIYLKCIQKKNYDKTTCEPAVVWLSDINFLHEACKIDPTILRFPFVRKYLSNHTKIMDELFKDKANYLLYFYDDAKTILEVAEKLSADQLELLVKEFNALTPEEREFNPLYYRILEQSLKELLTKRKMERKKIIDTFFHFEK